jgi:hypothetical protein
MYALPVLETTDRSFDRGYLFWLVGHALFTEPVDIDESDWPGSVDNLRWERWTVGSDPVLATW